MSKNEVERVWKVRRWHFIVSLRSKSLRFRVRTALCLVLSHLLLLKMPTRRCADLSSQAAAKPRGTYAKFTPENQAAIAKYASIVNDARSMVLGSLPNSPCRILDVQIGCGFKTASARMPRKFRKFKFRNFILRDFQFMRKFAPRKISRYTVFAVCMT